MTEQSAFPPSWAWISVDRDPDTPTPLKERVCAAEIMATGLIADPITDEIFLNELHFFSFNASLVADKLVSLKIKECYIDTENYLWLIDHWNSTVNNTYLTRPDRRGHLPSLRARERDKDPAVRQLSVMQPLRDSKRFVIADHIATSGQRRLQIEQWGKNVVVDAVAGACWIAGEQGQIIKENILAQRKADEDGPEWMGMKRVKYK